MPKKRFCLGGLSALASADHVRKSPQGTLRHAFRGTTSRRRRNQLVNKVKGNFNEPTLRIPRELTVGGTASKIQSPAAQSLVLLIFWSCYVVTIWDRSKAWT